MRHFIDLDLFSCREIENLVEKAIEIKRIPSVYYGCMDGRIIATLFYEPSTRTQFSFQTAMLRLGGKCIGFSDISGSSVTKGENFADTIRVISGYSDLIVIRHFLEGAAFAASMFANCPVINAGDGAHLHPTQTLTDLVTIKEYKGNFDGLVVGICGDLKYGRTVHSLIKALIKYKNNKFIFISDEFFRIPDYFKHLIEETGNSYIESMDIEDVIGNLDVLYMTRTQRERFLESNQFKLFNDRFVLNKKKLILSKNDMIILHPLPRVDEICMEVDDDSRAKYFVQAQNGVYARMSLIMYLVNSSSDSNVDFILSNKNCENKSCISNFEKYLPKYYYSGHGVRKFCSYCDSELK